MALSGSYDFSLTRDQLITAAWRSLGLRDPQEPGSDDITHISRTLNMMLKTWQAEGIGLWFYREAVLFPAYQTASYSLSSAASAANCTLSHVATAVKTAAVSGATALVVDSITGITASDKIGIELDDGTRQWTTVSGTPSGYTITLAAALTDDVAVDNTVYTYTTRAERPLGIMEARRHDTNDTETPLTIISLSEYRQHPDKTSDGTPVSLCYDPQLTNGVVYLWPRPENVDDRIYMTVKYPMNDLDAAANDIEFPAEWLEALKYNLAWRLVPEFNDRVPSETAQIIRAMAVESKQAAELADADFTSIRFVPDYD